MTKLRMKPVLSLLLVLLMVFTTLPMSALAAELPDETTLACTDEDCTHDHETVDEDVIQPDVEATEFTAPTDNEEPVDEPPVEEVSVTEAPVPETMETPESPKETAVYSGHIGDSAVEWALDTASGRLIITGSGDCETFTSRADQPWAAVRNEIREVWFYSMDTLTIENLAYWFDGCTALTSAELPYSTLIIGEAAFANCPSLTTILFCYPDEAELQIAPGAFAVSEPTDTEVYLIAAYQSITLKIALYDWAADNRPVHVQDVYGMMYLADCALGTCTCSSCSWYYGYYSAGSSGHNRWVLCTGCSASFFLSTDSHSYSYNGYCSLCGYYNSAYDQTAVCYHNSTYTSWSGCNWTKYCSSCGAYISSGTSHGSTYTTWNGCNWYDYCRDCGQLMDSGVSHSYSYGSWQYYSTSQHRRTGTCTSCGATTYTYGSHSKTTKYAPYSSTQHSYGQYCSTCASYVGSVSYANHSFSYGSWQNYSGTQHRRLKICATCGYSEYEYSSHSLSYGAWSSISATQHQRTINCSTCGYSSTETVSHALTYGAWENYSETQHRRTVSCSTCGYSTYEYADHSITNGAWASISDTQHERTNTCSCGYSKTENGAHADVDNDGYCDDCEYLMTRFSVTVPASLSLVVSKTGEVYSANNAAIINNSTGAVEVTAVEVTTANGWILAPYSCNMANAKVDTKLIGFALNGAATVNASTSENLALSGDWSIAKGSSLTLIYDAVVSAMSEPVSEQVLTIVFVLDWAVK